MNYSKEKQFAIKLAKESGKILLKYFSKVDKLYNKKKNAHEIVTPADLEVNNNFLKKITAIFPLHGVLSEETGYLRQDAEYLWVIDPLDGTTNFSLGNPFFNTSIALIHKGEIVLGVIYAPTLKQLFVAEKDKGAKLNNKQIKVSLEKNKADSIVNFGYSYRNEINKKFMPLYKDLMMNLEHTRNMGTAALELAWVAMGRLEAYILFDVKLWDVAAGILMVQESGGQVTDFLGKDFNLDSTTIVSSNKFLHKELLRIINKKS